MAIPLSEISIAANGDIRSVSGSANYRVIELHRTVMEKFDDLSSSGDDLLDVTNLIIPSERSTDQIIKLNAPYNIDATLAARLYGGSIEQDGGDTLYSGLVIQGSVGQTTQFILIQDHAVLSADANKNADAANNILDRRLVLSRTGGADIDGKRLRVRAAELGDEFFFTTVTLGQGNAVAAIITKTDDFNQTAEPTISGWTDVVQSSTGLVTTIDVDNNAANEQYLDEWTKGARTTQQMYERAKWLTRRGSSSTLHGMNGQLYVGITHSWAYDNEAGGPFQEDETVTWATGEGVLLALNDQGATGTMYIQLTKGAAPADNDQITGGTSSATCDVNGAPTARPTNPNCFLGNYTGSFRGAYGVGVDPADLVASDALTALDGVTRNPPNNITIVATGTVNGDRLFCAKTKTHTTTVSGAHSQGDTTLTLAAGIPAGYDSVKGRIVVDGVEHVYTGYSGADVTIAAPGLAAALSGGETVTVTQFDTSEFTADTAAGAYNDAGDTIIQVTASIGNGFPSSGSVRVFNTANGWFESYTYTGISGQQLTGISPALSRNIQTEAVFIPIVDELATGSQLSKTVVYPGADFNVRWRLYNAGATPPIKPFETPTVSVGASGSSTPMTRIADA